MEKIIKTEGMHCSHCSARAERALGALGYKVKVDLGSGEVTVERDEVDINEVKEAIEDLGFTVKQ